MTHRELLLELPMDQAEALSDALLEAGALSVSVEDAEAGSPDEQALFGEPGAQAPAQAWRLSRLVALVAEHPGPQACLDLACAALGWPALPAYTVRELVDQDWVRLTQSQFPPLHIGEHVWVVPSWHDLPEAARADARAVVLELDPGLAFGTGSHPTTRLCMAWLEQSLRPGATVLDYGCGSGILAIVAAKLGAGRVVGVDIDPDAVAAARDNAARNAAVAEFVLPDGLAAALPGDRAEVVVANILSNPLKLMAAMLVGRVAAGGDLVLSGVLARQADEVIAAYAPWMALTVWRDEEGWVCLHGTKTAN